MTALQALRTTNSELFSANNFDYLLARLLEQNGDRAGATASYQATMDRGSILSQYALWHLAQLARSSGDLVLERERLRRLIIGSPSSLLRNATTIRLAQSFSESKDFGGVVSTLRQLTESQSVPLARQALLLTGRAYLEAAKLNEAREVFNKLVATVPDLSRPDDFALAAVRALDELDKGKELPESDHSLRAGIYQFNRDFDRARVHYEAILKSHGSGEESSDTIYQIGRGYFQQGNFQAALQTLAPVAKFEGSGFGSRDALGLLAGTYARLKRTDDAINTYKQFIERYSTAPTPERPYLNIIDVLRDAGRDSEALSWVRTTRERFKGQQADALALFAQARIHFAQGAWKAGLADLGELEQAKDLGNATTPGSTTASEIKFLKGYALEKLGDRSGMIDVYLSIPDGRNEYYGQLASQHLSKAGSPSFPNPRQELAAEPGKLLEAGKIDEARLAAQSQLRFTQDPAKRQELLAAVRRAYDALPNYHFSSFKLLPLGRRELLTHAPPSASEANAHQMLADELLFLQLYDEAAPELAAARLQPSTPEPSSTSNSQKPSNPADPDAGYTFAVISLRGGLPYPAIRFAEQTWRSIPSDYLVELAPRQLTELLYPTPYRLSVMKHSQSRQLDPRFLLSIARQETRFQADAKSVAAARGLMQFIAATADQTAKELGKHDFDQDDLYNPDLAIEFGAQYLSSLFRQFPAQPQAVAAAYNGGPDNVARWIARSHSQEPDRYVSEIGFAQSKDYVFRVMSNYWVYQRLYINSLQSAPGNQ